MKKRTVFLTPGAMRPAVAICLACAVAAIGTLAQAKKVDPPPLPPGSAMVRVQGGMNDDEAKRHDRAHHHKGQNKKDVTRDDSDPGNNGNGNGNGNGKNK